MARKQSKKTERSKSSRSSRWVKTILIIILIAILVLCFKDRILMTGLSGEGSLLVTGHGKSMYYVYSKEDDQRINFKYTGKTMTLPAGHYKVTLHNSGPVITIHGDEETVVHSGVLLVDGSSRNLYEVWDKTGEIKLNFTYTGKGFEFFPGTYTIVLNGVHQKVQVMANDTTRIPSGQLDVTGKSGKLYYVYDKTGTNKLQFTSMGKITELLPGTYLVKVDKQEQQVKILPDEVTTTEF